MSVYTKDNQEKKVGDNEQLAEVLKAAGWKVKEPKKAQSKPKSE
jgi:hypothetical protein